MRTDGRPHRPAGIRNVIRCPALLRELRLLGETAAAVAGNDDDCRLIGEGGEKKLQEERIRPRDFDDAPSARTCRHLHWLRNQL